MKHLRKVSALMALAVTSCEAPQDVNAWSGQVDPLRQNATEAATQIPYQVEQQQSFKFYFGQIEEIAVRLTQDSNFARAFNDGLRQLDLEATCAKVFMPKTEWQVLMGRCMKEGFFLCSDEVKFYPELVKGIRAKLAPDLQQEFDQAQACQAAQ